MSERHGGGIGAAARAGRLDELSGVARRPGKRAVLVEDLTRNGEVMDALVAALSHRGFTQRAADLFAGAGQFMRPDAGAYVATTLGAALTTMTPGANAEHIAPYMMPWEVTADQILASCTTPVAGSSVKATIYAADALGRPGSLIYESAAIDTAAAATASVAANVTLAAARLYWIGLRFSAGQTVRAMDIAAQWPLSWSAAPTPAAYPKLGRSLAYASAATDWSYSNSQMVAGNPPFILMRMA